MQDDEGYGRSWSYRLFSSISTEPDMPGTGQRFLTVHLVCWNARGRYTPPEYPLEEDVVAIDHEPASPHGTGLEAALLDAERILKAFDQPVMIKAEWQSHFDWSEKEAQRNAFERASHHDD